MRCLIEYDDLVRMVRQAEGNDLISRQDLRDLAYRNRRRIRRLFASSAEYRRTWCTREDLRIRNRVARNALEVLVKSGFIKIRMSNDFDELCGLLSILSHNCRTDRTLALLWGWSNRSAHR